MHQFSGAICVFQASGIDFLNLNSLQKKTEKNTIWVCSFFVVTPFSGDVGSPAFIIQDPFAICLEAARLQLTNGDRKETPRPETPRFALISGMEKQLVGTSFYHFYRWECVRCLPEWYACMQCTNIADTHQLFLSVSWPGWSWFQF